MNNVLIFTLFIGIAEVDFVLPIEGSIVPLEVKSGQSTKGKSLKIYAEKYNSSVVTRASAQNLSHDGRCVNYPLYLMERFPIIRLKSEGFVLK
jgi:uncharacterized protein